MTSSRAIAFATMTSLLCAPAVSAGLPHGVATGDIDHDSAQLWALASGPGRMTFEISRSPDFKEVVLRRQIDSDGQVPSKVAVGGLSPATLYHVRVTDAAGAVDRARFRTLPAACAAADVTFGATGDWRSELAPYPAVRNMPERKLDFLVALGDTIYAENYSDKTQPTAATLPEYRARHRASLSERIGLNVWRDVRSSVPMFATIDDHEVVNDFAGGAPAAEDDRFGGPGLVNETARYRAGMRAFFDYMPLAETLWSKTGDARFEGRPMLYRLRTLGRTAMFVLLDARSFRDDELPEVADPGNPESVDAFRKAAFKRGRTMLGKPQFARLKADLLAAKEAGVLWKFVMIPEPIQNLGPLKVPDRYEGYAAERAALLGFIRRNEIANVVFVAGDMHASLVNNLSYQTSWNGPQKSPHAFEVVAGPVAFDPPYGPYIMKHARKKKIVGKSSLARYESLPIRPDADKKVDDKDDYIRAFFNRQLDDLGYRRLGLAGSSIDATLLKGDYVTAHHYGWTEFHIDGASGLLSVRTWGVPAYTAADIADRPAMVRGLQPALVTHFEVRPKPVAAGGCR